LPLPTSARPSRYHRDHADPERCADHQLILANCRALGHPLISEYPHGSRRFRAIANQGRFEVSVRMLCRQQKRAGQSQPFFCPLRNGDERLSVYRVLQALACSELGNVARRDLHFCARLRVTARACFTAGNAEIAKANEAYVTAVLEL